MTKKNYFNILIILLISFSMFRGKCGASDVINPFTSSYGYAQIAEQGGVFVKVGVTGGDGTNWQKAYGNLQDGINAASAKPKPIKVYIAQGTYKPTSHPNGGSGDRYKHFSLRNGIEVIGGFPGENIGESNDPNSYKTIISGDIGTENNNSDNVYHVFYHPSSQPLDNTSKLEAVTITKGNANGTSPHDTGGAMYNHISSPTLNNVTFDNNEAQYGGGMYNKENDKLTLTNVTFTNNTARIYGGAMRNWKSSCKLTNVTFTGNISTGENTSDKFGRGGGIANTYNSNPTLDNVTFDNNEASYGSGMYNRSSSNPTLDNVTFTSNAGIQGGAMRNHGSSPKLTNVTFIGNTASEKGGAMANEHDSHPSLDNTVVFKKNIAGSIQSKKEGIGGAIYNVVGKAGVPDSNITGTPTYGTGNDENKKVDNTYNLVQSNLESGQ